MKGLLNIFPASNGGFRMLDSRVYATSARAGAIASRKTDRAEEYQVHRASARFTTRTRRVVSSLFACCYTSRSVILQHVHARRLVCTAERSLMFYGTSPFLCLAAFCVLPVPPASAQTKFVLKAACIGGAVNTVTEVVATADGTISRRNYYNASLQGREWKVLGRDRKRVHRWLRSVDATKMNPVRVPTTEDRNPCRAGSSRPCHLVRRKGTVQYYACQSPSVMKAMLNFNEFTGKPRARGALEILDRWREAFLRGDVDALVKLYAPDALLLGADSTSVISGAGAIRSYFENAFRGRKPHDIMTTQENLVLSDNVVVVTSTGVSAKVADDNPVPDRITFVLARRGKGWRIVHSHSSAMPN